MAALPGEFVSSASMQRPRHGNPVNAKAAISVAVVILLAGWGRSLFWSFWNDEAGTYWMAHDGPIAAVARTWHWPGQSILYAAIASFFCLDHGPLREFLLRLPTLMGMIAAGYFVYRLAEEGIGRHAGVPCAILFAFHPLSLIMGNQARPYGLALGAVTASVWALVRWVETRERRYLCAYVVASALIVYLHYFFVVIFVVHSAYILCVFISKRCWPGYDLPLACAAIGVLAAPLVPHMLLLAREAHTLPMKVVPELEDLVNAAVPLFLLLGVAIATLVLQVFFPARLKGRTPTSWSFLLPVLLWCSLAPLVCFGVSTLTAMHIFVPRYYSLVAPAQALALGYTGYAMFGAERASGWALLAVLSSVATPLGWFTAWRQGGQELRPVIQIIRSESAGAVMPGVFYRSELPESDFYEWRSGLSAESYLYAPFVAYPIRNHLLPLPYTLSPNVKLYISSTVHEARDTPKILFVTRDPSWIPWMMKEMEKAGYEGEVRAPNSFRVVVFRRRTWISAAANEGSTTGPEISVNRPSLQSITALRALSRYNVGTPYPVIFPFAGGLQL